MRARSTAALLQRRESAGRTLTWLDGTGMVAALVVLLVISYLRSRHRIFWGDEIVGWILLRESTFAALYRGWSAGADSSGLFYYVLARPWLAAFGATEVSARAFTTMGVWAGLALTWVAARRYVSAGVAGFGVCFVFLATPTVVLQLSNARTYGLFLAAAALVALLYLKAEPGVELTAGLLAGTAAAHALLIGSHVLGVVYSGFFVLGMIALDGYYGVLRWRLYLAAVSGWVVLLWVWRNLKANADIGKPYFWTEKPHLYDVPRGMVGFGWIVLAACGVLAVVLVAARGFRRGRIAPGAAGESLVAERMPLYFLLGTFWVTALFLFGKSEVGNSVFTNRYVLPMVVAGALLLCDLGDRVLRLAGPARLAWLRPVLAVVVLALLVRHSDPFETGGEDYTAELVRAIPAGVPAVITDVSLFAEVDHYEGGRARLETEIDWPFTLSTKSVPRDVTSANMLTIWKRLGYFPGQILPAAEVLQQPEFVVISRESFPLWFEERIAGDGRFEVTDLGLAGGRTHALHVWLVRRRQG